MISQGDPIRAALLFSDEPGNEVKAAHSDASALELKVDETLVGRC